MSNLKHRGLKGENLEMIVSDGALGLLKVMRALYPRIAHQLYTFHKATDLGQHMLNKARHNRIISDALYIFEAKTATQVRSRLKVFCDRWWLKELKVVKIFVKGFEYCLT